MGIVAWLVVGLIAGVLAKLAMPGPDPGGIGITIVVGIVGALLGGFIINRILGGPGVTGINLSSILARLWAPLFSWPYTGFSHAGWHDDERRVFGPGLAIG